MVLKAKNSYVQKRFLTIALAITAFLFLVIPQARSNSPTVTYYRLEQSQNLGGLSGLVYLGKNQNEMRFLSQNDQGPKANIAETPLQWIELETDSKTQTLKVIREIPLKDPHGRQLTGADIDPEGITMDNQGNRWMCEESIPSLLKFDREGRLLKRYIPVGSLPAEKLNALADAYGNGVIIEALPEHFDLKKTNRGFEGITYAHGKIYASLQKSVGKKAQAEDSVRLLEFDITKEETSNEFFYPLSVKGVKKIGDLAYSSADDFLYLIEQNTKTGGKAQHFISKVSIAKNMKEPEQIVNLSSLNYDFAEKVEGLAFIGLNTFAFINDNDFKSEIPTVMGIIQLQP